MSEKLCIFCEHFNWHEFRIRGGSEYTGEWMEGGLSCAREHYYEQNPDSSDDLRALILKAETCGDYRAEALKAK